MAERAFKGVPMTHITYQIVEHEDGWAYKLGDVFSERFATRDDAMEAAKRVAAEQRVPGESTIISYQDAEGRWHQEQSKGIDRPDVDNFVRRE